MIEKNEKRLIITFNTTTDVLRAEKVFKENNILGKIISIPSEISAGCGLTWQSEIELREVLIKILKENYIEYDNIYEINK